MKPAQTGLSELGEGRLVRLNDADVHVYETGPADAPPILFLHGFLTSSYTWRSIYPALTDKYRMFFADLPGSGKSPDPLPDGWFAEEWVRILEELLDALSLNAPTLVGSQMGGSLAAWFSGQRPHRVDRLVVMAAGALGETTTNLRLYRLLSNRLLGPVLARSFPRQKFEQRWKAAHGPTHVLDPAVTEHYFNHFRARGPAMARVGLALRQSYGKSFNVLAGSICNLTIPTLLLFGDADPIVPLCTGRRFEALINDARLVILPGCGDFPQEERADDVSREIIEFMSPSSA